MLTELGLYKLFGEDPEQSAALRAVCSWGRWRSALAPTAAYGADRVPDAGGIVVASNHLSAIDPLILPLCCPRTVYPMAKIELLEVPVAGEALRWLGSFAVRRGEGDRDAIRVARWIVAEGHVVGFFSEGTRQQLGYPGASHAGAAMIAIQEGVPLVPCGLDTFQWSHAESPQAAPSSGASRSTSRACRGTARATRRARPSPTRRFSGSGGRRRKRSIAGLPDALPDGARRTGPLSGDDVSYVDATPWPDDEWARGPLGPVYPGAG